MEVMALSYGGNGTILWRKWHYLMEEIALYYGGNDTNLRHYLMEEMALSYGTTLWRKWHYLMEEIALSYGGNCTILWRKWHYLVEEMAPSHVGRRNILTFIFNVVKKKSRFTPSRHEGARSWSSSHFYPPNQKETRCGGAANTRFTRSSHGQCNH